MKNYYLLIYFFLSSLIVGAQDKTSNYSFNNPALTNVQRVDDLVSRLTLPEKIKQMQNTAPAIERLEIPAYNWWNECLHGVARNGVATVFPQAIAMAATWNPNLIFQEADVISTEARAKYAEAISKDQHSLYQGLTFWSPNINIFRDPRWGRGQETYGEDPFLTAQIGTEFVKGLQGNDPKYFKVIATAKHFAVHSGPEPERHVFDAWPTMTDLYETYLPAFEALVKDAKVYSFMGAYNRLYGTPSCANNLLLEKTLRNDWKFDGYVVSDCWAISDFYNSHKFVPDAAKASALAVKAGTDLSCGSEYEHLNEAVKKGYISEAEIDISVKRLFMARMKLGMFDSPAMVKWNSIQANDYDTKANHELAAKVARESIVLLKNEKSLLPLDKKYKHIAVIGPYADEQSVLIGNYNGTPSNPITILQGIRNRAGKLKIEYATGVDAPEKIANDSLRKALAGQMEAEAIAVAKKAQVIVFVGGISPELEGEEMPVKVEGFKGGDRTSLDLPASQVQLLKKLNKLGKPIVMVLTNGSALSINWANDNLPAIVEAWYSGGEGGNAVADVLFGNYNPAGRLPITFYKSVNDLPAFEDYGMKGRTYRYFEGDPLYAFGYGLSFTQFKYNSVTPESSEVSESGMIRLKVQVKNTGKYDGDEVVQIYFSPEKINPETPIQSLIALKRVPILKGETKSIEFVIPANRLRHFDSRLNKYVVEKGKYKLFVGASSNDIRKTVLVGVN